VIGIAGVCPWSRDDGNMSGWTRTLPGGCLGQAALGREQCDGMSELHKLWNSGTTEILWR
jgi:hypothetical protein